VSVYTNNIRKNETSDHVTTITNVCRRRRR